MVDRFNNVKQILQGFKQAPVFEINPGSLQMELERASIRQKLKAIEEAKNIAMRNRIENATARGLLPEEATEFLKKEFRNKFSSIDDIIKNAPEEAKRLAMKPIDAKNIAMRNRIESATAKGLLPEGAEEFLRQEFRKKFSSIDNMIKNAPQEAKRLTSGYKEMLRRTAPTQGVKQVDANKIASLLENAQQGANKNIIIKNNIQKAIPKSVAQRAIPITARGALSTALPYVPVVGSVYDIVAGGKKILRPEEEGDLLRGLGQAGLGVLGLVPGMQWTKYAKLGKLSKLPMATKAQALGYPTAGALVGGNSKQQPLPLETIEEPIGEPTGNIQNVSGMQYAVLPEPPNSNAIANDMANILGAMGYGTESMPYGGVQIQQTTPQQQYAPIPNQYQPAQQNQYNYSIAQALLDMYNKEQGKAVKQNEINRLVYQLDQIGSRQKDRFDREYYANIAKARDNQALAGIPSAIGSEQDLATSRYQNRLQTTQDRINKLNAVNTLAGNIAVANQMGMDPAVAMADKDIQKVLTAYNQIGGRENVANINAMAKMYGADRGVDVAKIKAMAQALSTDARLSASERMYYANLANKLDIARMNATVAPYRFGYDITPEYVDLINSGASIQAPVVPTTNVFGGMLGNQGFTNQLDFNRINRGN